MTGASPHTRNDSINLKPPELFDCIGTGDDELVRGVVLVGGDQQSAAEAGAGFADGAAERIFVRTTPTRRIETRRAFYHY